MRAQISCKMSVLLRSETAWGSTYDLFCGCDNDPPHLNLPPPMNQSLFRRLFACRRPPWLDMGTRMSPSLYWPKSLKYAGPKFFKYGFFGPGPG